MLFLPWFITLPVNLVALIIYSICTYRIVSLLNFAGLSSANSDSKTAHSPVSPNSKPSATNSSCASSSGAHSLIRRQKRIAAHVTITLFCLAIPMVLPVHQNTMLAFIVSFIGMGIAVAACFRPYVDPSYS